MRESENIQFPFHLIVPLLSGFILDLAGFDWLYTEFEKSVF